MTSLPKDALPSIAYGSLRERGRKDLPPLDAPSKEAPRPPGEALGTRRPEVTGGRPRERHRAYAASIPRPRDPGREKTIAAHAMSPPVTTTLPPLLSQVKDERFEYERYHASRRMLSTKGSRKTEEEEKEGRRRRGCLARDPLIPRGCSRGRRAWRRVSAWKCRRRPGRSRRGRGGRGGTRNKMSH